MDHQKEKTETPGDECPWSCRGTERPGVCRLLFKSMYGTRDAAANVAARVMDTLVNMKFEVGKSSTRYTQADQKERLRSHSPEN